MNKVNQFFLNSFKDIFIKRNENNASLDFDEILQQVLNNNSLKEKELPNKGEIYDWFKSVNNTSYLNDILETHELEELIIHSTEYVDVITARGKECLSVEFLSQDDFKLSLSLLTKYEGIQWNYSKPFCSFTKQINLNSYRITIIHDSITKTDCPKLFVRKINANSLSLQDYNLDDSDQKKIKKLISDKSNMIIAGSTGSGKTTFLNTLISYVKPDEHIVVIEDTQEIGGDVRSFTHLLAQDKQGKSMKDFCKYALRMSPQRIILGEMRSDEVIPFILSINTGHKGMMSTIHANSARDTLFRLAMLFCTFSNSAGAINYNQILKLICQGLDHIVFLENKRIKEVIEIKGCDNGVPIYTTLYHEDNHQEYGLPEYKSLDQ